VINFYSIHFILFLGVSLICYYTVFKKKQWMCLLFASAYFYYWTGIENFIFLFITGFTTWAGARWLENLSGELEAVRKNKAIEKTQRDREKAVIIKKRRSIMWCVVILNFGILAFIKYTKVIMEQFAGIFRLNLQESPLYHQVLGIVLPLGISFYMFQSIGYLLDIYNQKYAAEKHFGKYMLYVSYFPQMIQGPINRYDALSVQMMETHNWCSESATKAVYRITYGLFKKFAIANVYAGIIADIFDAPVKEYAGVTLLFGILLYSFQQYADFSGGIDMVLGVSELFGIHMAENFKQPYFSTSLADFWRRWHISLGKWMRDYLFYPFALTAPMKKFGKWANKKLGKHLGRVLPAAIGNVLVFFVVGIWHGAQWHYIVWGLYNGLVIAFSDILSPVYAKVTNTLKINVQSMGYRLFQIVRTFIVVNIGWYFDRIEDVKEAFVSLVRTFTDFRVWDLKLEVYVLMEQYASHVIVMSVVACVLMFVVSILKERGADVRTLLYTQPLVIRWSIYLFVIGFIIIANADVTGTGGFMYANF